MNFTREPIIESVITPRDGCKLVLRSSKSGGSEEYIVEAVEVVSFGRSIFYRSVESAKAFLLPVSDYEVVESKEARIALKSVQADRQIKIGGGRDAQLRPQQQPRESRRSEPSREPRNLDEAPSEATASSQQQMPSQDRKRGDRRRRGRRGRGSDRPHDMQQSSDPRDNPPGDYNNEPQSQQEEPRADAPYQSDEPVKSPSFMSKLFPPPPTLIKETLSRYKTVEETESFPEAPKEKPEFQDTIFDLPVNDEKDEDIHSEDR